MMFVNGEVAGALNETTALVEEIVRGQVVEMILRSSKQAFRRGARSVQVEDLIFPIRHDRAKVSRLTTYLSWKDVRKNAKEADVAPVEATADPVVAGEDPELKVKSK
jgi:transcription initiation protein SPT3